MRVVLGVIAVAVFSATMGSLSSAEPKADGARLFRRACVSCHGADGKADTPMGHELGARDLTDAHAQDQTDAELYGTIANGKGNMPGFDPRFKPAEIQELVKYIRQIAAAPKPSTP